MTAGYLRLLMETGSEGCTGTYEFEADDGTIFTPVQNIAKAPIETHIYVEFEGNRLVRWDWHPVSQLRDNMNKDVALTRVIGPNSNYDNALQTVERGAAELEYWLRLVNRDAHWEHIRVTPYVLVNHDNTPLSLNFPWHRFRDQMEEQYPGRFEQHIYWHGWCAMAWISVHICRRNTVEKVWDCSWHRCRDDNKVSRYRVEATLLLSRHHNEFDEYDGCIG